MAGQGDASERSNRSLKDNLPDNILNLLTAALIWLFGVLVFLPMARRVDPTGLSLLCSSIIFAAFTVFLVRGLTGFGETIRRLSESLVQEWTKRKKETEDKIKTRERINTLLQMAMIIIVYLLYFPILRTIHPSINGLILIITILMLLFTLRKR